MPIQVVCANPQCRQLLNCPDSLAGRQTQCPKCKTVLQVPTGPQANGQGAPAGQPGDQKSRQLGKYQLLDKLGTGGMGVVYKAVDTTLNRTVALKILSTALAQDQKYVSRFMREGRAAAALSHPNIVGAVDFGQEGRYYYFAMEFVDGENVRKLIKNYGVYKEAQALDIAIGVTKALQHAWTKKIVHRDIKPDNIMLSLAGEVKLADMGLAKATDSAEATLTQAGHMIGTPQFASPEQIRGETNIDCRTDIYSLGMTLYYLVVGQPAFDGPTAAVITSLHLDQPFPDPRATRPELSDGFCTVLQKMTMKAPEDRYQSPEELLMDMQLVRNGQAPVNATAAAAVVLKAPAVRDAVPAAKAYHGAGKFLLLPLAAVLAVAIGAGYLFWQEHKGLSGGPATPGGGPAEPDPLTQRASALLRAALRHSEQNPFDFPEILNRLNAVKTAAGGTSVEAAVSEQIDTWQKKWNTAAETEFGQRKKQADGFAQNGQFEQALALWSGFPATLCTPAVQAQIGPEKERLKQLETTAAAAAPVTPRSPGDDTPKPGPQPGGKTEPPGTGSLNLAVEAYNGVMQDLGPAFQERNLEQIPPIAERLLQGKPDPTILNFLRQLKVDAPKAQKFLAQTREALKGKIGQQTSLAGIPMKILAVDDEKLTAEVAGAEQAKPFLKMRGKDLLQVQGITDETAGAENLCAAGFIHFIDGQHRDALDHFSRSGQDDVAKVYRDFSALGDEAEALKLIEAAKSAFEKNELSTVQKLVKDVRESYEKTQVVRLHEAFLKLADELVLAATDERQKQLEQRLRLVEQVAQRETKAIEQEYETKKDEIEKAQTQELTLPETIVFKVLRGISRGRGKPEVLKDGDSLPMDGGGWQLKTWCEYKIEPKEIAKEEQLKHLDEFVLRGDMDLETKDFLKTTHGKLKKEIQTIRNKYSVLLSRLKTTCRTRIEKLEAKKKRMVMKVKDGETPSEEEIRSYLVGGD